MAAKQEVLTIPAGEFKAKCLALIDDVSEHHQDIVITKRGVPMARLVPIEEHAKPFRSVFGLTPGTKTPTLEQMRKAKQDFADEMDASTERLASQLAGRKKAKR